MKIASLIKSSTVDFPGEIVATIFLAGCNFDCDFCQNYELISPINVEYISEKEVIEFLKKRKNLLDGICISGGEPTLQGKELVKFIKKIKKEVREDFLIKLDTNASNIEVVKELKECLDYIAIDFKSLDYSRFSDFKTEEILDNIKKMINLKINYEVRITMYPEYIKEEEFEKVVEQLYEIGVKKIYIQQYQHAYRGVEEYYSLGTLEKFRKKFEKKNIEAEIR
ncbi:pyruvate formate lyase activating enzyme [Hypnocyclicus thermotrophus]|uniref:Pyruvate formate lyase activating enzyme n=1 Tax=Hypnocyclicus thermotrophus TaxID=1627895 RepID=A0AA46DY04_9FUSO|nr:anaerobic ribonucleoside-triphosphate reductase activating protein [Hypnocyclicus thermotrophus]TDT69222.1 pyruvate formate lyase activating enzyme [Hypnocyclicus thermotrophus]